MADRRGLAYEVLENERTLLAVVRDGNVVSSDDWEGFLTVLKRAVTGSVVTRHLVYVEIAAPPAGILRRISEIVRGNPASVALLSPSTALRFVVSTFSLVNRSIRYFTPEQLTEALVHIHCNDAEQRVVRDALVRMRERA